MPNTDGLHPYDRKILVRRLRLEGAQAAQDDKHPDTCPYKYASRYQWLNGYKGFWGTVEDCQQALNDAIARDLYSRTKPKM